MHPIDTLGRSMMLSNVVSDRTCKDAQVRGRNDNALGAVVV